MSSHCCCARHREHPLICAQDVDDVLREEYPGTIDVVYEGVGGPLREAALESMAPDGRLLAVGYISEYFHVKADSHVPAASKSGLPPAHELLWQGRTAHIGGKTIYGQVWSGVSKILPHILHERII